jgi:protein-S-isoprenylcysteine O-methyltransferase Ste14
MFLLIYILFAAAFLVSAFLILRRVRHDYQKYHQLAEATASWQAFMFCIHILLVGFSLGLKWPPLNPYPLAIWAGILLAVLGLLILLSAMYIFGPIWRMLGLLVEDLKRTGVYRWSRNPQLIGYGLMLWAIPLLWPSWYVLASVILYWPMAHMMILGEEKHLRNLYGEEYEEYCRRTPRYIGIPRKGR